MRNRLLELLVCDKANSDSLGRMAGMVSHHEEMTSPQVHSLIHLIAKSSNCKEVKQATEYPREELNLSFSEVGIWTDRIA